MNSEDMLRQEALTLVDRAQAITITDQGSYDSAADILTKEIKPLRSRWKDYWYGTDTNPGPVRLAQRVKDSVLAKFNEGDDPLKKIEERFKKEMLTFEDEQKKKTEELQIKAQREAEEKARIERDQLATFAELAGAPKEQVDAIVQAPIAVVATPVQPTFYRPSGIVPRSNWKARVTDMKKLCKAIGEGKVPTNYVLPNESALNKRAQADQLTMNIPGVVPYDDKIIGAKGK